MAELVPSDFTEALGPRAPLFKQRCQSWKNTSRAWQQNAINTEGRPLNQSGMPGFPNDFFSNKLPAGRAEMNFIIEDKWTVQYL